MKALENKALLIIIIYIFKVSVLSIFLLAPPPWKSNFVVLCEELVGRLILLYGLVPSLDSPNISSTATLHH